jgi:hypothetical protein
MFIISPCHPLFQQPTLHGHAEQNSMVMLNLFQHLSTAGFPGFRHHIAAKSVSQVLLHCEVIPKRPVLLDFATTSQRKRPLRHFCIARWSREGHFFWILQPLRKKYFLFLYEISVLK